MPFAGHPTPRRFYHRTRADLVPGDLIVAGYSSNYGARKQASCVYLTGMLEAAIWGAELAIGDDRKTRDDGPTPPQRRRCCFWQS